MKLVHKTAVCLIFIAPIALAQTSIKGTVTNKTTGKVVAGDDVVLIRLAQGMQESTRSKTDSKGKFSLEVPDPGGVHLVRVTHDKANYFQPVQTGTDTIDVDVYTGSEKVEGITGEADVMRIQTDPPGSSLAVVENFFVKNDSAPPKTQFGPRAFEFYLPEGAVVDGSAALGPGGMPVRSAPVPIGDTPNHYAFIFPIRPGESRFQVSYHVPYKGSLTFTPRPAMTTDTVALILPKSMTFKAAPNVTYTPVAEETTTQTYAARNVAPSEPLGFSISGTGQLPRETESPSGGQGGGQPGSADPSGSQPVTSATDTRPGIGLNNPIDPTGDNDPWAKYKWWILGGLGLLLAGGAGFMLSTSGTKPSVPAQPSAPPSATPTAYEQPPSGLLAALKEELFALETDKLQGRLTEAEYHGQKAALEVVLRRALARAEA